MVYTHTLHGSSRGGMGQPLAGMFFAHFKLPATYPDAFVKGSHRTTQGEVATQKILSRAPDP